jgi:hypothetical protein
VSGTPRGYFGNFGVREGTTIVNHILYNIGYRRMLVLQAYAVCCNTSHTMVNKVALDPRRLTESAARSLMYFILIFLSRCLALIVACIPHGMPGMSCLSCLTGFCRRVPLWRALICSVFLEKMGWWRPIDFGQFPIS